MPAWLHVCCTERRPGDLDTQNTGSCATPNFLSKPKTTASHAVRAETGKIKIEFLILKELIAYSRKILLMTPDRTPRRMYEKLKSLVESHDQNPQN